MHDLPQQLKALGLTLPPPPKPGGNYVPVVVRNRTAYVAIQLPKLGTDYLWQGRFGTDLTAEDGYKAAQLVALNILSQLYHHTDRNLVLALNHFDGYYQASGSFNEAPHVFDGASDLFVKLWGENGRHTRAIFGVERLPLNLSVGITAQFAVLEA